MQIEKKVLYYLFIYEKFVHVKHIELCEVQFHYRIFINIF